MVQRRILFILFLMIELPKDWNVLANVINTTVTAYTDWLYPSILDIYEDQVTWFDALGICYDNKQNLEYKEPAETHRATILKQALLDANYTGNLTFWTTLFKPQPGVDRWYRTTFYNPSVCSEHAINFTEAVSNSKQCSVWRLTGTDPTNIIYMSADDCAARHPFMCFKLPSNKMEYTERIGWSYGLLPAISDNYIVPSQKTIQDCRESCGRATKCVSWSFWHNTAKCGWVVAHGYAYVTYEIEQSFDNVTHGYKASPHVTLHPETLSSSGLVYQQNFPQCNFSTLSCLQSCYCSKQIIYNTSEIEEVVKELIQNLTVNKDVTSKSRRKLVSVDDTRPSAQRIGLVGVVILSLITAGIVMVDAPRLFHLYETYKRLKVIC